MDNKLSDLLEGQVGRFWPLDASWAGEVKELRGFVQRNRNNFVAIKTLDDGDPLSDWRKELDIPLSIVCASGNTTALALRPSGSTSSKGYGGFRAATREFRYQAIISGVAISRLKNSNLHGVEAQFRDSLRWAGMPVLEIEDDPSAQPKDSVVIRLDAKGRLDSARVGNGIQVHLLPHWEFTGKADGYQQIETPLAVRATSTHPLPIDELLQPILDMQLLMSLAHGAFIPCFNARARPSYLRRKDDPDFQWSPLWDRQLMRVPAEAGKPDLPLFTYSDMGGIGGVARWLRLSRDHGRFIRPVTMRPIFSTMAVTTRLLEIHAGIEYFVAAAKKAKHQWAPRGKEMPTLTLARRAGPRFATLVGDVDKWAKLFHDFNIRIKHEAVDTEPIDVYWMTEAAASLVTGVALDHASTRKKASRRFYNDHRTEQIGRKVREVLDRHPNGLQRNY
ncbi:ApeA N-terminal domain 1-containing protein [Pseudonocardia sp. D17]|uniref:ApeA N-terminal domain 1-containing protein n=1 Tax=Pseudonocardia sp. D17 TaxID=882661 RepID=UPI002B3B3935|nr:hypothetical protein PSD17_26250 [Pseudonocardia sp. D17]